MANLNIFWSTAMTGNTVTSYKIGYSPITSSTLSFITGIPSGTTSYTITGLNASISYSGYVESECTYCYSSTKLYWIKSYTPGCQQSTINFTGQTGMTITLGNNSGWSILEVSGTTITPSNSGCTKFDIYYPSYNPSTPLLNKITNIGNNGHVLNNNGIYYVYFYYSYNGLNTNIFIKYSTSECL